MPRLLPFTFLVTAASAFGLTWIVVDVDPNSAPWYIFALFVFLLFLFIFCFLGLVLYFVRVRFNRPYNPNKYVYSSFKIAFLAGIFLAICAGLGILQVLNLFNLGLAILATSLLGYWSYLGKTK